MILAAVLGLEMVCRLPGLAVTVPDSVGEEAFLRAFLWASVAASSAATASAASSEHGVSSALWLLLVGAYAPLRVHRVRYFVVCSGWEVHGTSSQIVRSTKQRWPALRGWAIPILGYLDGWALVLALVTGLVFDEVPAF